MKQLLLILTLLISLTSFSQYHYKSSRQSLDEWSSTQKKYIETPSSAELDILSDEEGILVKNDDGDEIYYEYKTKFEKTSLSDGTNVYTYKAEYESLELTVKMFYKNGTLTGIKIVDKDADLIIWYLGIKYIDHHD